MPQLKYPLVCFDLDGTLVDDTIYIWKTLHETFNTDPIERQRAYDDYFAKRITYEEWFNHDLKLLKAAEANQQTIDDVLGVLRPMHGAHETIATLKEKGHKVAIISGSIDIVVHKIFPDIAFDHLLINRMQFDINGEIGGGTHTPFDVEAKADGLKHLCELESISTSQTVFVGDNVNDLWIAKEAGLSIAFNCKSDELREIADVEIREKDLRLVLPHVG
jgi:phosphoserine phosphatase